MKLWFSPTSPYARKVRIVLREKQIRCAELLPAAEAVDLSRKNPLAKVPTLELDDGTLLFDSVVIVEYLDGLEPAPRMIPEAPFARALERRWEALADGIADAVVLGVMEGRRAERFFDPAVVARQHGKARAALAAFAETIARSGSLTGEEFSLADAAFASAFGYVELRAPALLEYPTLRDYYSRLCARPSVAETTPIENS